MVSQAISHYRIIKKLGAGGMGEVYLAEDTKLARKVAIKLVLPKSAGDEQARKRLIREARAAARLDHPNICAIHEVGEEANGNFIIMQYVEGETLASIIHKRHLELRESLDIAMQILSALSEAHTQGIIHRDIKPQNIIVTSRGQVKVLDFGLAKTVQRDQPIESEAETQSLLTEAGVIVGTVGYMSPEQARGAALDARSDLFSLGALLYECVTGRPAFSGNNLIDICAQVIHVDPQPPSKLNPHVPPELDSITLRALAKEADARYQSAGELLEDLRRVRDTSQAEERLPSQPVALEPTTSRIRALATLSNILRKRSPLAAAAMIVSLIAILAVWVIPRLGPTAPYQPLSEAKRWYDAGTNALRDGAYFQASKALERAISLDDKFALAHARLAEAWTELDYSDRAKDELLRVTALVPDRSALPSLDALYLRAITDTVTREFASAIESYRSIAEQVPEPEKPFAYVDLGRAYEKNEDVEKAIESYDEASRRESQYAAAFLHKGMLFGRKGDLTRALDAFAAAETVYQALTNNEGEAEVHYQRGYLLNSKDHLSQARNELQEAFKLTQTTANKDQQIRTLLQLSSVSCTEGNLDQAQWQAIEAVSLAQSQNLENAATNGLIDVGNAFFARGDYGGAENYFKQALEFAQSYKGRRSEARAQLSLGSLQIQQGNHDSGIQYIQRALAFYQQGGYSTQTSQALLLLARTNDHKGDYTAAFDAFNQQLQIAQQSGDQSQTGYAYMALGNVLDHQERYSEALNYYEQSRAIYQSLSLPLNIAHSLMNSGHMLWQLGRYEEARAAFKQVFALADHPGGSYNQLLALVSLFDARMALSKRMLKEAKLKSKQSLLLSDKQYKDVAVRAKYTLGLAQALSGLPHAGLQLCKEAESSAVKIGDPRFVSGARLALAEVMIETGSSQDALTTALQAQEGFAHSGQKDSQWRSYFLAARACLDIGNEAAARDYASRAVLVLADFEQRVGAENYSRYLARPDIQSYHKQLDAVLNTNR